ncbi:hypothetical protein KBD11_01260 [Candidatus Saccharibacteria bacterium]|jgi:hypothetical protein|nr:hypothetical protein [Candidatus Saccharibacteria bacterium]
MIVEFVPRAADAERSSTRLGRRAFLGIVAAGVAVATIDATSRNFLDGKTNFTAVTSSNDSALLSVCIPGLNGDIRRQTRPVMPVLREYGDVVLVDPSGEKYDFDTVVRLVADEVERTYEQGRYNGIVINGLSLGGNVGVDVSHRLHDRGVFDEETANYLTLFDTPADGRDIRFGKAALMGILSEYNGGSITNQLPSIARVMVGDTPAPSEIDPTVVYSDIEASFAAARTTPNSFILDQADALYDYPTPKPDSLKYLTHMVYARSTGENIVDTTTALKTWRDAVGDTHNVAVLDAAMPHVGFEQQPTEARKVFTRAYRAHLAA